MNALYEYSALRDSSGERCLKSSSARIRRGGCGRPRISAHCAGGRGFKFRRPRHYLGAELLEIRGFRPFRLLASSGPTRPHPAPFGTRLVQEIAKRSAKPFRPRTTRPTTLLAADEPPDFRSSGVPHFALPSF